MKKILLLEDDETWAEDVQRELQNAIQGVICTHVSTEFSFRRRLDELVAANFDVAIFDIMVSWASYEEIMEQGAMDNVPAEVEEEFNYREKWRTGIRCKTMLSEKILKAGKKPPSAVFFTVLQQDDLQEEWASQNDGSPLVVKGDEGNGGALKGLVQAVHTALSRRIAHPE